MIGEMMKGIVGDVTKEQAKFRREQGEFGGARNTQSQVTRQQFEDYKRLTQPEEDKLLQQTTDTSIVDTALDRSTTASNVQEGITQRNIERYGSELTPAQRLELSKQQQRTRTLTDISAENFARRDQMQQNLNRLLTLGNLGVMQQNRGNQMLGIASGNEAARQNAYKQDQANARAQRANTIGTVAMLALAI